MADAKISALSAITGIVDSDELVLARAGATKKITGGNLRTSLGTLYGDRDGWGPIDSPGIDTYLINSFSLPSAGCWVIVADIRFRWNVLASNSVWFQWGTPDPAAVQMESTDQTNIQKPPSGWTGDLTYGVSAFLITSAATDLDLTVRTFAANTGQVQDGDALVFGLPFTAT